jgi:hypothetical protein
MVRFDPTQLAGLVVILLLVAGGCGYRSLLSVPAPAGSVPSTEEGASHQGDARRTKRVAVLALRNDSPEPWLDRILADAMRREIGERGGFDFVNDPRFADIVLRGRIRPLGESSMSFSRFVAAVEYGLTLQLDLEVLLAGGDIIRLDSRMLAESDVYLASADIEVTRSNKLEVLRRLSDLLASRVADSIEMIDEPLPSSDAEGGG